MGLWQSNTNPGQFSQALSPLTQAWSLPEGIMCSAYRESCVFLWGQFEGGREEPCGHYPKGPDISGTLLHLTGFNVLSPFLSLFNKPVRDRQDCFIPISQVGKLRLEEAECLAVVIQPVRLGTRSPSS